MQNRRKHSVSLDRDTNCHPIEGAELSAPSFFLLSYAGNEMTSLSDGSSFGCFSYGCMALSNVPMSR